MADPSVVDEHIDPAELVERSCEDLRSSVRRADVSRHDEASIAQLVGQRLQPIGASRDEDDGRARGMEDSREVGAETTGGARDDGDAAIEAERRLEDRRRRRGTGGDLL